MRDPFEVYNNTLVPMVVEQSNRGERAIDNDSKGGFNTDLLLTRAVYLPVIRNDVAPIFEVLKQNADKDGHLRHACVQALAWIGEAEPLVEAAQHESPSVRRRTCGRLLPSFAFATASCAVTLRDRPSRLAFTLSFDSP